MNQLDLWSTTIFQTNLAHALNIDEILQEIIITIPFSDNQVQQLEEYIDQLPLLKQALEMKVKVIQEQLEQYAERPLENYHHASWIFYERNGVGMDPHYHTSRSLFTATLYLTDSVSPLVIQDPRGCAGRCLPEDMRKKFFANHRIFPKAGDVVLFPSHISHFVPPGPQVLRMTIGTDFFFE